MSLWAGWLREVDLTVPEGAGEAGYYAELLGGRAVAGRVELGDGTAINLAPGSPSLSLARLELLNSVDLAGLTLGVGGDVQQCRDPDGRLFALTLVDAVADRSGVSSPRLGHITYHGPNPLAEEEFFGQLGFLLSDALGDLFRWLRINPIHHTLAFARAPTIGVHHIALELASAAELISACDRLSASDHRLEYGPGRHRVGGNLFAYFFDRNGLRWELVAELERIRDPTYEPRPMQAGDRSKSVNVWGPQPPATFDSGY